MIKRDFSAWDFVKQGPKKDTIDITGGTLISDYTSWTMGDGSFTNTMVFGDNVTITIPSVNNRVYISDLTVQGSAEIPPQEGQMRYNVDSQMTEVYHQDEWMEIGYTHDVHQEPKISRWKYLNPIYWFNRFVNFMENRA